MESLKIAAGFALDLLLGDPPWFTHPVRLIGGWIGVLERALSRVPASFVAGIALVLLVVPPAYLVTWYLASVSPVIEVILIYTVFATSSLGSEALAVHALLERGDLAGARARVGMLVSRDTAAMDEAAVTRAVVETVAENLVDGVIAPLFYLLFGGVGLAMAYKAASTLDSMVGYKNEKYLLFGRASARLDDVLNFIPARLAGFLFVPVAALCRGLDARGALRIVARDRHNHASPNSAHGEAAFAGALGVRLGGPTSYFGVMSEKPYIGEGGRQPRRRDIVDAVLLMRASALVGLAAGIAVRWGVLLALRMAR